VDPGARCPGMAVYRGRTRGKITIPASPAEGFPGLSFSRSRREERLGKLTRNDFFKLWCGAVFLSWRLFLTASSAE